MTAPFPAMIFAAGFGTRMGRLTQDRPKPMVPLAGRPMIDRAIDLLRDAGVSNIVANAHYMADCMIPHLERNGVTVSHEQGEILDTGGGLRAALPRLGDGPVITLNPDALWLGPNPVQTLLDAWTPDMKGLLMLVDQDHVIGDKRRGDFSLELGEIRRKGPHVYGGAQIIDPGLLHQIEDDVFSLNQYWDHLAGSGPLNGIVHQGRWGDIGTPEGLALAERALADV